MKSIILILIVCMSTRVYSQDILPLTFGPLVSMTSTTLNSTPSFKDQISGAGYDIGGMVRFKLLIFYAQGEIAYGTKSSSVIVADTAHQSITFKLNGPDISAILGLKLLGLGDIGNLRVFGGYNWNNFSDITYSIDGNEFDAGNVKSNNHSYILGCGVDLLKFSLDLKYIGGLVDLTDSGDNDVNTTVINLTLAYRFK